MKQKLLRVMHKKIHNVNNKIYGLRCRFFLIQVLFDLAVGFNYLK